MTCNEFEKLIYNYPELDESEKEDIKNHYQSCDNCKRLYNEVDVFFLNLKSIHKVPVKHENPQLLTERIMNKVSESTNNLSKNRYQVQFYVPNTIRYSLAAVSCGILFLFFIEIIAPNFEAKVIEPKLVGSVIKSDELRESFRLRKSKKSIFEDCKNQITNKVNQACVKEKLDKLNL
jgi:hypothetical protein